MSITFTKLFSSITASTVWCTDPETKVVWITLLAMADKNGRIWGSVPGIAGIARVPVESCRRALDSFLGPDPDSRTKEHEGRRIEAIDGGWKLLNYAKYRALRDEEERKEYKREWIANKRSVDKAVDNVDQSRPQYTHAEAEAEAEKEKNKKKIGAPRRASTYEPEGFTVIKGIYPKRGGGQRWGDAAKAYQRHLANGITHEVMEAGVRRYADFIRTTGKEGSEFVQQGATFMGNNKGFLEPWNPPAVEKVMSSVEKVRAALDKQFGDRNERVVSEQQQSSGNLGDPFGDVRQSTGTGLRRIGS